MSYYTPKSNVKQLLTTSLSLNCSLDLNILENENNGQKSYTQRKRHERQFSDRSFVSQNQEDEQNKIQKRKMGIQLGILEKQILGESKINLLRRDRNDKRKLNRSSFMKQKQVQRKRVEQRVQQRVEQRVQQRVQQRVLQRVQQRVQQRNVRIQNRQITSQNLQQIRKIDKRLYQLYINLFNDIKQLSDSNRNNDNNIVNLQMQLKQVKQKKQFLQIKLKKVNEDKYEVENEGKRIENILLDTIRSEVKDIQR